MRAEDHDLLGFIGAGNFRDDVEGVEILFVKFIDDIDAERYRQVFLERAENAPVVFDGHRDARQHQWILGISRAAARHRNRSAIVR